MTFYIQHIPEGINLAPVLVVLPGVNSGAYLFEKLRYSVGRTHRLIILNPPGVDGVPMSLPFSVAAYARHALKTINALDVDHMAVMGHSMGGFAAQELAHLAPDRVERLILVSTSPGQPYTSQDMSGILEATGKTFWEIAGAIGQNPHENLKYFFGKTFPASQPAAYAAFVRERQKHLPSHAASMAQTTAGGMFSSTRWVGNLDIPTLVVHGSADILVRPAGGRALAQILPDARYLELYGVGHFPMLEHPRFAEAMTRFLVGQIEGEELPHTQPGFWKRLYQKWFLVHG